MRNGHEVHGSSRCVAIAAFIALLLMSCSSLEARPASADRDARAEPEAARPENSDPSKGEVCLDAARGWHADLVLDLGSTGLWTVMPMKVFPQYGCPEIVGIDDLGRCHVLWSYSGKWTPVTTVADGTWLGGLALADVDPRVPGAELYTGAKSGTLYQIVPHRDGRLDNRLIGSVGAREVHTVVAGDFDPRTPGNEVLAFTSPGGVFRLTPRSDGIDGFRVELLEDLPGRVRDAVVLPSNGGPAEVITVGRDGLLQLLRITESGLSWSVIHQRPMGMGRVAVRPAELGQSLVVYSVCDDGLVYRHERQSGGRWTTETVYAGPQGMRGLAAGRFDADPAAETVAVFGYSTRVELLTRRGGQWQAETILQEREKGHWICRAEVDGRNGTDELVATGYTGRIVLLSRPPGYGLDAKGAAVVSETTH